MTSLMEFIFSVVLIFQAMARYLEPTFYSRIWFFPNMGASSLQPKNYLRKVSRKDPMDFIKRTMTGNQMGGEQGDKATMERLMSAWDNNRIRVVHPGNNNAITLTNSVFGDL